MGTDLFFSISALRIQVSVQHSTAEQNPLGSDNVRSIMVQKRSHMKPEI